MVMSEFAELCRTKSSLAPVQIDLLGQIAPCLPFVADLARGDLRLYVPARADGFYLLAMEECSFTTSPGSSSASPGLLVSQAAEPLVRETFRTGKHLNQWQEGGGEGRGTRSFAVMDGSGTVIAAAILSFRLLLSMDEYTQLLHAAGMVLQYARKLDPAVYRRLTTEDGILVADRFHRIVFADEIVLHIYRNMGVGSLVGRNLFDSHLWQGIDRETTVRKRPWEKELQAGERILREVRMDFAEGGNPVGHIVLLSDITEMRRREQDARIQEALMKRIQELEDELESIKDSLETRKLLDRAKGILMDTCHLTEVESYRRIQRQAMVKRMTIKEVAEMVIASEKSRKGKTRMGDEGGIPI